MTASPSPGAAAAPASPWLPALGLAFNAFVWGVSWWPLRQLQALGLHPLWATVCIYALPVLLISLWRPAAWPLLLRTRSLWVLVLAAGITNAAFNWAVTLGDVVRVVLLFYLMPLWAVLLARALLAERISPAALLRVALALAGAALVLGSGHAGSASGPGAPMGWPLPRNLAEWLGVLGGFTFALNNVMLRRESRRAPEARALAMFLGGALVSGALALALSGSVPLPHSAHIWWWAVLLMGGVFLLSNLTLLYGAARLPAGVTAVVMVSEVLFASVSAVLLGAGSLSLPLLLGGALIVCASLLAALRP